MAKLKKTAFLFERGAIQRNEDGSVTLFSDGGNELFTVDADTWVSIITHVAKPGTDLSLINSCAAKLHNGEFNDAQLFDLI